MNIFVISDIHGMYKQFEQLLQFWDHESKLVLLGDLVDRGPQSLEVIRKAIALKATYGEQVVFCKGNHEQMLLDFIHLPEANHAFYLPNGGRETIKSFLGASLPPLMILNHTNQVAFIKEHFVDELEFLESGKLYEIIGDVLLTHAGFETHFADIGDSIVDDFLWIRDHYLHPNQTPYINVFGHTPTRQIHENDNVWISDDKKYIGIDGGCAYGGQLNAVILNEQGEVLKTFYIKE